MAKKSFTTVSAYVMLLVYLVVMVVSNVSVIVCDCHSHHLHQSIAHEQHKCCCGGCHDFEFGDHFDSKVNNKCGCLHDHSNDIDLYIAARSSSDDSSERNIILAALLSDSGYEDIIVESCAEQEYDIYITQPLSSAKEGSESLRAPPVMV